MSCILVGGGSRSGKSRFALEYARRHKRPLAFIATAGARDEEMRSRVEAHQAERGSDFHTIEEPFQVARAIQDSEERCGAIVVDCLTLWISNLMFAEIHDPREQAVGLLRTASESPAVVVLVTNEVGCGIVPENAMARQFRDLAGSVNQLAASAAKEAYWMMFGVPMRIK